MRILDALFPQNIRCIFCGKEDNDYGICDSCYSKIPFVGDKVCKKCGGTIHNGQICGDCKAENYSFERVFAICEYSGILRNAILKLKSGEKYIANPLACIVSEYFSTLHISYDIIIPMPIHKNRLRQRGFNQSEVLLQELAKADDRIRKDIIIRSKDTPHQTGLTREYRKSNLDQAFQVLHKSDIKDKTIVIFDDIYTTGSSMQECAKTLKENGASKVFGVCLARTPIGDISNDYHSPNFDQINIL